MKGAELKELRYKLHLTKFNFGRLLGFTSARSSVTAHIHRMENGRKHIPLYIARLAWLLGERHKLTGEHIPPWPNWPDYVIETDAQEIQENKEK